MDTNNNILIVIPHGGTTIPEELLACTNLEKITLFMESDACANDIFNFENAAAVLKTEISPLFIDLNKPYLSVAQKRKPGVIRRTTRSSMPVFLPDFFPDTLAIANILKRHYMPFHKTLKKILNTGEIDLVLICHTMWPIGPPDAPDANRPRPEIMIHHMLDAVSGDIDCGHDRFMEQLKIELIKNFNFLKNKNESIEVIISSEARDGYILRETAYTGIPVIELSVCRSLFLNDEFFNPHYCMVDPLRIKTIKIKLWKSIQKSAKTL